MGQFCERRNGAAGRVLVAVGANLPGPGGRTPLETCRGAVASLSVLPGFRLRGLSRWYVTAPVPASGQPDYVNAVAALVALPGCAINPVVLLADLMAIEANNGRRRGEPNAARTLDLDIVDIDGMIRAAPDPIVPHPRAHERAFVLIPLIDVAPDWVHPVLGRTAAALLSARTMMQQNIRAL